jgi:hypothetical protein
MTMKELEKRVAALESEIQELKAKRAAPESSWLDLYGKYRDDPVFAEIVRLGKEWRDEDRKKTLEELDAEEPPTPKKPRRRRSDARA